MMDRPPQQVVPLTWPSGPHPQHHQPLACPGETTFEPEFELPQPDAAAPWTYWKYGVSSSS